MDQVELVAAVALLIAPVVSFLKSPRWPEWVVLLFVGAVSFGVAVLSGLVTGDINFEQQDLWVSLGVAFAESQAVYRILLKGAVPVLPLAEAGITFNNFLTRALWGK